MVPQSSKTQTSTSVEAAGSVARDSLVESHGATMPGADSTSTRMPSSRSTAAFSEAQLALKWGLEEVSDSAEGRVTRSSRRRSAEVHGTDTPNASTGGRVSMFGSVPNIFAPARRSHSADVPTGSSTQGNMTPVANEPSLSTCDTDNIPALTQGSVAAGDDGWAVVPTRRSCSLVNKSSGIKIGPRFFMGDWFELLDDASSDSYGSIPSHWAVVPTSASQELLSDEMFMRDLEEHDFEDHSPSIDSDEEVDQMLAASTEPRETLAPIQSGADVAPAVHAVIVEEMDVNETEPESKPSPDEKPSKGKGVDPSERGPGYREFLRTYVTGHPGTSSGRPVSRHDTPLEDPRAPPKPSRPFRRDPSELPSGGWFEARTNADDGGDTGGPPTPPSSSSSNSSSSDSSNSSSSSSDSDSSLQSSNHNGPKRKSSKRKTKDDSLRRALKGIKLSPPSQWDGRADLDTYETWMYQVDTWAKLHGLPDRAVLRVIVNFMSGKASRFFMKHVATCQAAWTLKSLYEALFDYCFPEDFKESLRTRLLGARQGQRRVRDFVRDLEALAERFPDVTQRQLTGIFWNGLHQYLRLYLIEKGLSSETTSLKRLVKYADRREKAYETKKREDREFEGKVPGRTWGRFSRRDGGNDHWKPDDKPGRPGPNDKGPGTSTTTQRNSASAGRRATKSHAGNESTKPRQHEKTYSKEELDRMRARDMCFNCREVGHQSRNCPRRQTARAPAEAHAGAVRFSHIDELMDQKAEAEGIPVGSPWRRVG